METLSNFSSIYCFIAFVIGAIFMLTMLSIAAMGKSKEEPRNKVRFFVARRLQGELSLYLNKPQRNNNVRSWYYYSFYNLKGEKLKWVSTRIVDEECFKDLGLNPDDFKDLKWEDEPVEVFLNLED